MECIVNGELKELTCYDPNTQSDWTDDIIWNYEEKVFDENGNIVLDEKTFNFWENLLNKQEILFYGYENIPEDEKEELEYFRMHEKNLNDLEEGINQEINYFIEHGYIINENSVIIKDTDIILNTK